MKPILAEDIYSYTLLSSLKMNPSGNMAVLIDALPCGKDNDYKRNLCLVEKNGKGMKKMLTHDGAVQFFEWEDDTHILFVTARTDEEKQSRKDGRPVTYFYRLDLEGGEAEKAFEVPFFAGSIRVLGNGRYLLGGMIDVNEPDLHLADKEKLDAYMKAQKEEADYEVIDETPFWGNGEGMTNKKRSGLYLFDANKESAEDGRFKRITPAKMNVGAVDVCGEMVFFAGETVEIAMTYKESLSSYNMTTGETKELLAPEYSFHFVKVLGDKLLAAGSDCRTYGVNENPKFFLIDPEDGAMKEIASPDICVGNAVLTDLEYGSCTSAKKDGDFIYFVTTVRSHVELRRIDASGKVETLLDREGAVMDFDIVKGKILLVGMYDQLLHEVYALTDGELIQLSDYSSDVLKDKYVAVPQRMSVDSCGWDIDGWVMYPIDYDPTKKYPAVLDIHGGPKCAYGELFFHEMQMWAGMGYFVFFCNPYGGEGRGNDFAFMRDKYGTTDYQNIMDFTDAVLEKYPAIDQSRVCETGGSYGGFMTNWIVTHTDRFCCAATQRSISNWISMYGISDIGHMFTIDQCGADISDDAGVQQAWSHSPLKYAANCRTPLLFIHSDEDYRCPISEGYQFYTYLANHGVPTRMCVFHGENHELSRTGKPKHRIRRLTEINQWFEKYSK